MENYIDTKDVAKKIQGRQDLLAHDLKVVDSVNKIIKKYKKEGYRIVDVKNEATILSETKKGVANDQRNNIDLGFMDAMVIVEKEVEGKGTVRKSVGVEFGDYSLSRMRRKLNEAQFDEGYVFSSPDYQQSYMRHIETGRSVSFLTL